MTVPRPPRPRLGVPAAARPATGALGLARGPEMVRQSILLILDTEPGERVMRPTSAAGCGAT